MGHIFFSLAIVLFRLPEDDWCSLFFGRDVIALVGVGFVFDPRGVK